MSGGLLGRFLLTVEVYRILVLSGRVGLVYLSCNCFELRQRKQNIDEE